MSDSDGYVDGQDSDRDRFLTSPVHDVTSASLDGVLLGKVEGETTEKDESNRAFKPTWDEKQIESLRNDFNEKYIDHCYSRFEDAKKAQELGQPQLMKNFNFNMDFIFGDFKRVMLWLAETDKWLMFLKHLEEYQSLMRIKPSDPYSMVNEMINEMNKGPVEFYFHLLRTLRSYRPTPEGGKPDASGFALERGALGPTKQYEPVPQNLRDLWDFNQFIDVTYRF